MVVFILAERLNKIFNQDGLFASWQLLEVVSKIENVLFGNGSAFLW